ncbi:D-serine ammonia-lyase [Phenylobacterium sp. LjRoot225]|uniref:D-serine ammonia-lyase n=1 Tax=Phenylobacterium sp. LjRoot225 TaxID=3342285 RepID=UPI003ECE48B3
MTAVDRANEEGVLSRLRRGEGAVWINDRRTPSSRPTPPIDVAGAEGRWRRFAPVLAALFPEAGWDGQVRSPLVDFPGEALLVKCDHALPMTGSIKARGGVHEVLFVAEGLGLEAGLIERGGGDYGVLASDAARGLFARSRIMVASTGNLGFSVGLVARALGFQVEVHMSADAKRWKKERLRALGAKVIEHDADYSHAVASARGVAGATGAYFVDDEYSPALLAGYATAARELADQLSERGVSISLRRPLHVYIPCGVGGAPGGVTYGLKAIFGEAVRCFWAQPAASACMIAALAAGDGRAVSVQEIGLSGRTAADGMAVPRASDLVLDLAGHMVEAIVALHDAEMQAWVRRAWRVAGLRLELSGAAGLAAVDRVRRDLGLQSADAVNVAWTTGGALLPDSEFQALL